jgi:hypothetical protein
LSRIRTVLLLCAFVLLGLRGRWTTPTADVLQPPVLPPGSAEAEQDAWRLRLVQLGLATGHAPHRDPFLDAPEGRVVPWPPLFHALLGAIARHTTLQDKSTEELGSVGEGEILALAARLLPLLGMLGVLGAFFVARAIQGGVGADWAGLSAAALWAALPSIRFAESAGRIDPHALTALLSWATLGATAFALRARQEIDTTLGGLCAGVAGGLAVCSGLDGAVALASCTFALLLAAVAARPGARRAAALFAVTAVVVVSMSRGHPFDAAQLWPAHAGWGSTKGSEAFRHWPAVGLSAGALIVFALGWRHRRRTVEAAILLCGMAWALAFDPGAAGVAVACVLAAAVATGDAMERTTGLKRGLVPLALAALAVPALVYRPALPPRASSQDAQDLEDWRAALHWMRNEDPAEGPWNHPSARPRLWLLTAPSYAATLVLGSRWPTISASPPGLRPSSQRAEQAAGLLAGPADESQVEVLRILGVSRIAVSPAMEGDPWLAAALSKAPANNLFQALLGKGAVPSGLERVGPPGDSAGALSVWRVAGTSPDPQPASLRSR